MANIFLYFVLVSIASTAFGAGKKSENGRFQIVQISDMRRDQYLIDSQTGTLWTSVCVSRQGEECVYSAFTKVDVEGINVSYKEIFQKGSNLDEAIQNRSKKPLDENSK